MKKKLFILCLLAGSMAAQAQDDSNVFTHFGVSVGAGTTGITIDLSTNITDYVGVRAGVDIMPKFKYATDIKIDGIKEKQVEYDKIRNDYPILDLPAVTFPEKVDIEGKLNNTSGHVLFDLYPGSKIDWHLTVGAYFGPDKVISVYTTDDSQLRGVSDYNNSTQRADAHRADPHAGYEKIGAQLGDYFLEPDAKGHIDAYIKTSSFRPYLGIGWGRNVPKNHSLGFSVDLGAQFWGTPKIYCQENELKESDVEGSDGGIVKALTKVTFYPTLTFRLTGKIF